MTRGRLCLLLLPLMLGLTVTVGEEPGTPEAKFPFRFLIESAGGGPVEVNGVIEVDGTSRKFDHQRTPFEFHCEAASELNGSFEPIQAGRKIRVRAFVPLYSETKPIAKSKGRRISMKWSAESKEQTLTIWSEKK